MVKWSSSRDGFKISDQAAVEEYGTNRSQPYKPSGNMSFDDLDMCITYIYIYELHTYIHIYIYIYT